MIVIKKAATVMLSISSINTQIFDDFKSSTTSHFIKGKSKNLKKLLRYLSGIVTSVFKGGVGGYAGCGGWFPSWSRSGCAGRAGVASVIPIIFFLSWSL